VLDIVGEQENDDVVVLDLEAIRVSKPGCYELDLVNLFSKEPLVIKLSDGKYIIDIVRSFQQLRKKENI
jgi:predicted  nucleic acid-binding Zn-ribbon protein